MGVYPTPSLESKKTWEIHAVLAKKMFVNTSRPSGSVLYHMVLVTRHMQKAFYYLGCKGL